MTDLTSWLDEEISKHPEPVEFEDLPSLRFQPGVVTELEIDFSQPFGEWTGDQNGQQVTKKIIPVSVNGVRMKWWLNEKNPIYREILTEGRNGNNLLKIVQEGENENTRYLLVD